MASISLAFGLLLLYIGTSKLQNSPETPKPPANISPTSSKTSSSKGTPTSTQFTTTQNTTPNISTALASTESPVSTSSEFTTQITTQYTQRQSTVPDKSSPRTTTEGLVSPTSEITTKTSPKPGSSDLITTVKPTPKGPRLRRIIGPVIGTGILVALCAILVVLCRLRRRERSLRQGVNWEDEGYMGVSERGSPVRRSRARGQATKAVKFANRTYEDEIAIGISGLSHENRSFVPVVPPHPAPIRKTEDGYVKYNPTSDSGHAYQQSAGSHGQDRQNRPLPSPTDEEDDYMRTYEEVGDAVGARVWVGASVGTFVPQGIPNQSQREVSNPRHVDCVCQAQQPGSATPIPVSSGQSPGGYVDVDNPPLALQPTSTTQIPSSSFRGCVDVDSPGSAIQPVSTSELDQSSSCGPSSKGYVDVDFRESPLQPKDVNLQSDDTQDGIKDGGDVDTSGSHSTSFLSDSHSLVRSEGQARYDGDSFEDTVNLGNNSQTSSVLSTPSFPQQNKPSTTGYVDVDISGTSFKPGGPPLPATVDSGGPSLNPPDVVTDADPPEKAFQPSQDSSPTVEAPSCSAPSQIDIKSDEAPAYFTLEPPADFSL